MYSHTEIVTSVWYRAPTKCHVSQFDIIQNPEFEADQLTVTSHKEYRFKFI